MGYINIYIRSYLVVVLSVFFYYPGKAQADSAANMRFAFFRQNIQSLHELYCFSDTSFYHGKYRQANVIFFIDEFNEMNLSLFRQIMPQATCFYNDLEHLPDKDKKNFVRLFSFYEKDFEAELKSVGLPAELKYLAPALSAMYPYAVSVDKRLGVWQLTHFQAVLNGGETNRLVDERFNVLRSTRMAARQLKENFEIFETPELAVLAFLCGNAKLRNALPLAGENADSYSILSSLPENVSNTIAAFQAVAVFLNTNRFEPEVNLFSPKNKPDTVLVSHKIHFQQIENVIGVPVQQLRFLNPQYKFSIIPSAEQGKNLVLPSGRWDDFVLWQDSILCSGDSALFQVTEQKVEYPPEPGRHFVNEPVKDLEIDGKSKIQYRVKTGDVLGVIAEKYDVSVSDLKYWNNISDERRIQAGQKLDIFVPETDVVFYSGLDKQTSENTTTKPAEIVSQIQKTPASILEQFDNSRKIEHVVKNGESPFVIAKKYEGVTPELILEWNQIDDPRKIQVGQKLTVYLKR